MLHTSDTLAMLQVLLLLRWWITGTRMAQGRFATNGQVGKANCRVKDGSPVAFCHSCCRVFCFSLHTLVATPWLAYSPRRRRFGVANPTDFPSHARGRCNGSCSQCHALDMEGRKHTRGRHGLRIVCAFILHRL